MKFVKNTFSLLILNIFLLFNFVIPVAPGQAAANTAFAGLPFYLEIEEENIDSFPVSGHTEGAETLEEPFWIEAGRIFFHPELAQAVAQGKEKQNFNLLIAPQPFEEKNIKLLVKHDIHFEGNGRNMEITHYYIFDTWPAVIPFEPMNVGRAQVNIDLEENEGKLLNIRLTEENLSISFDEMTGKLRCTYGSIESDLPKDRAWQISEKSQKISISRQFTTRHNLKNPVEGAVPETTRHEFGEVEFKTKLTLKNLGSFLPA
ncbi:MAG: hypothetical protein HY586_04785 [Candidatus Omnitrophica bacterium]|nr:hypothetical protein [Candidatus Omnitrophota bacterium]